MHIHRISNVNNRTTFRLSRFVKYEKSWFYLKTTNTGIGIPRILTFRSKHLKTRIILSQPWFLGNRCFHWLIHRQKRAGEEKKKKKRSCFFQIPTSSFKPNIYHSWVTRHAVKIVRETWQISRVYLAFLRFTRLMGFTLGLRLSVLFSFPRADLSLVKSITLFRLVFLIRSKYNSFFFYSLASSKY